jgi:hypothetical protein
MRPVRVAKEEATVRPKIDEEPTFDPLQLFTSEEPAEGAKTTSTATTATTQWRPIFVPMDEANASGRRRSSRAVRFGFAAVVSLVSGIFVGFAGGYISAQRLTTAITAPRLNAPLPQAAPRSVAGASSTDSPAVKVTSEPSNAPPEVPQPPTGLNAGSAVDRGPVDERAEPRVPVAMSLRAREGSIEVLSRPSGADVALDGRVVGQTPLIIPNVEEGTHVLGIELSGFSRWATSVRVEPGKSIRVGASLTP